LKVSTKSQRKRLRKKQNRQVPREDGGEGQACILEAKELIPFVEPVSQIQPVKEPAVQHPLKSVEPTESLSAGNDIISQATLKEESSIKMADEAEKSREEIMAARKAKKAAKKTKEEKKEIPKAAKPEEKAAKVEEKVAKPEKPAEVKKAVAENKENKPSEEPLKSSKDLKEERRLKQVRAQYDYKIKLS